MPYRLVCSQQIKAEEGVSLHSYIALLSSYLSISLCFVCLIRSQELLSSLHCQNGSGKQRPNRLLATYFTPHNLILTLPLDIDNCFHLV
jgi:hypothetical protein